MQAFLIRETLGYAEFTEALVRLYEEQNGIKQEDKDFGIPPAYREESWYGDEANYDPWDDSFYGAEPADPSAPEPSQEQPSSREAAPGASPTRSATGPTPAVPSTAAPAVESTIPPIAALDGNLVSELSITDSFIMGVLRGWRLLQAASLSNEEKRDILSTTRNQMDYESISSALRLLWDEQLLGPRHAHSPAAHQGYLHYQEAPDADHHGSEWQQGYSSELA